MRWLLRSTARAFPLLVSLWLFSLGLPLLADADTGYRQVYDYPDQGAGWYGNPTSPDPRYDYPVALPRGFSAGDDYGTGYDPRFAILGQPVDDARTRRRNSEYEFRFVNQPACIVDDTCNDGLVCNGTEFCDFDTCASGTPPSCNDADACTTDTCVESAGGCQHKPLPPPAEVGTLLLSEVTGQRNVARLRWAGVAEATAYNVYRGEQTWLSDLTCTAADVPDRVWDDDGRLPPRGGVFVHLVSATACGESSLGKDSSGNEREASEVCP